MPLDPHPSRTNLTSRECASILGGLIGSLTLTHGSEAVRSVVRYAADTDELWDVFSASGIFDKAVTAWSSRRALLSPPETVSRAHLTSLVGLAGGLVPMASGPARDPAIGLRVVRSALRWWSDTDAAWESFQKASDIAAAMTGEDPS